jgi:2-hydroxychromene-2-carboxylate isomerase
MTQRLEFFFDFVSPYSYLAHSQLPALGVEVTLRPMTVLKVMEVVGNSPTTVLSAAKGRYAGADLGRWAARYGVPLRPGGMRTNDSQACARAALAAGRQGKTAEATTALFHAFWGEGASLKTTWEILAVLDKAGLDIKALEALIDSPEITAELAANTAEAAERGVFGAPTIFVEGDMFFGNDRLDFVRERLGLQGVAA